MFLIGVEVAEAGEEVHHQIKAVTPVWQRANVCTHELGWRSIFPRELQ
jgi:hypothetical protein